MTKHVRVSRPGSNLTRESDLRIKQAIATLSSHERGRAVLKDLAQLFNGQAMGLDLSNMSQMVCLVREFAMGNRRGFLDRPRRYFISDQDSGNLVLGFDGNQVILTESVEYARPFSEWEAERFVDKYQGEEYGLPRAALIPVEEI